MHILIAFDRFGPYHWARTKAVANKARTTAIELFPDSSTYAWDKTRCDSVPSFAAFPGRDVQSVSHQEADRKLGAILDEVSPDVVAIPGWSGLAAKALLRCCLTRGIKTVLMSESTAWDFPRKAWKEWFKGTRIALFDAALVGGNPHRDYVVSLGMPTGRVQLGYDAVDNTHFLPEPRAPRAPDLPAEPYFLASCRFIAKKNLQRLLTAFAAYREAVGKRQPWNLVLLGDGALRPELERHAVALGVADSVSMPGFRQYSELPGYYHHASAFVHASTTEQWGLVVNEAMAAGLPIAVSERCGCAADLVKSGVNGKSFNPTNTDDITGSLRFLWDLPTLEREAMGQRSIELISHWSPERFASGLLSSAEIALTSPVAKRAFSRRLLALPGN